VLEGSVRKSGNNVRITAQLIDAVNDRHLWSETYSRELTDIFAIQEEIANAIVNALRRQLGTSDKSGRRGDRACRHGKRRSLRAVPQGARALHRAQGLPESIRLFEQVTRMDPDFAAGWEGLPRSLRLLRAGRSWIGNYARAVEAAAEHALQLDPSLSMPWAAHRQQLQEVLAVDWSRQFLLLDRAIAADSRNATAYLWRGIAWLDLGFFERALARFRSLPGTRANYRECGSAQGDGAAVVRQGGRGLELFERGVHKASS
jgi:tetratricopeptide (TPR) repeat protein